MRIAMMTNNYLPFVGGVPISIERLANGLRELGNEVFIFAPSYEEQDEEDGVIRIRSLEKKLDGNCVIPNIFDPELERQFRSLDIDMIHVHHPMVMGYAGLYLGKRYGVAVDASGVCDIVKDGVNGYRTAENTAAWSDKICACLENGNKRERIQRGAYETALRYRADVIAARAERSYESAVIRAWERRHLRVSSVY